MRRRVLIVGAAGGGAGAGLLGLAGYGLLRAEAALARRAIPVLAGPPLADGDYPPPARPEPTPLLRSAAAFLTQPGTPGPLAGTGAAVLDPAGQPAGRPRLRVGAATGPARWRLAMLGDSLAAGVGVDRPAHTPGALLAAGLAAAADRPVLLDVLAVTGSRSADLAAQVSRALLDPPDLAVVSVGANDVTHSVPIRRALADQRAALGRLVDAGVAVVLGACPDLGGIRPIPQPLRRHAGRRSRRLAGGQLRLAGDGVTVVDMGQRVGRRFRADPALFCPDRFHPSAAGYALVVAELLPAVLTAAGLPDAHRPPDDRPDRTAVAAPVHGG